MKRACLFSSLLLAAGGCGPAADLSEGTPETSAYLLEVTGDPAAENLGAASAGLGESDGALCTGTGVPEWLVDVRKGVATLNGGVRAVLDPIAALIASQPSLHTGDTEVFVGDRPGATYRFTLHKAAPKKYGWLLQVKALGAPDASYVAVMGGAFAVGELPRRGRGVMGVDLTKLGGVDATVKGRGQLLVGFAHVGGWKILKYGLHQFTPDPAEAQPVDALFSGWKSDVGRTDVRLALDENLPETATPAKELLLMHGRWVPAVGGRVDALVVGGDVPQGTAVVGVDCFDGVCAASDEFEWVAACPDGAKDPSQCKTLKLVGDASFCKLADAEPPASTDPMQLGSSSGAPEDPPLPGAMPDGTGN